MRLSDAIAMGRTLMMPKAYTLRSSDGREGCALGMGLAACGMEKQGLYYNKLLTRWSWLLGTSEHPCDCRNMVRDEFICIIMHLFDRHVMNQDWTLDRLIDWVRSVEPAEKDEDVGVEYADARTGAIFPVDTPAEKV